MASFGEHFKQNLKEDFRSSFEQNTGIIGQTMRARREKEERQKEIAKEVDVIKTTTVKIHRASATLNRLETSFVQISKNFQLIAKAMDATITLQEETNASMGKPVAKQPQVLGQTNVTATPLAKLADDKETSSLFDNISSIIDKFHEKFGKKPPTKKPPKLGENTPNKANEKVRAQAEKAKSIATQEARAAGQTAKQAEKIGQQAAKKVVKAASAAAVKSAARKALAKSLGKVLAKSIPFVGVAAGAVFAAQALMKGDYTSAGLEVAGGLVGPVTAIPLGIAQSITETYFDLYGVDYATDALTDPKGAEERLAEVTRIVREEAEDMLKNRVVPKKPDQNKTRGQQVNVSKQEASDLLNRKDLSDKDLDGFGGRKYLESIAGVTKPEPVSAPAPAAAPASSAAAPVPNIPIIRQENIRQVAQEKLQTNVSPLVKAQTNGKFSSAKDFIAALLPYAQKVSRMIGGKVPAIAILGQWAGESGAGSSMPADFNYAGIKAGSQFAKGDFVLTEERYTDAQLERARASGEELAAVLGPDDKMTKKGRQVTVDEWYGKGAWQAAKNEGKNWVQVKSYFAKFKDFDDFASSFAKFISAPRYSKAREQTTPSGFGFEIAKAGYATASAEKYSAKIANFAASQGSDIGSQSTEVAAAKKDAQVGGNVTIIAVDNTQTIKRVSQRTPGAEVIPRVG